jgi:hypothetical protein
MAPSQPVAGVEIEAARGEETEADGDENQVQHLCSPKTASQSPWAITHLSEGRVPRSDWADPLMWKQHWASSHSLGEQLNPDEQDDQRGPKYRPKQLDHSVRECVELGDPRFVSKVAVPEPWRKNGCRFFVSKEGPHLFTGRAYSNSAIRGY